MIRSTRKRNLFTICMLISYLAFGLACILDNNDDDPTTNNPKNNTTTNNGSGSIKISGSIEDEQTWKGVVNVTGDVSIRRGAKLTIEAGTEIVMCADCSIAFSYFSEKSTILANGTAEKPIVIHGASKTPGFWKSATFGKGLTSNSVLKHLHIKHGGQSDAAAVIFEAPALVEDMVIEDSGDVGLQAVDFKEGSKGLKISKTASYPVVLTSESAVHRFPTDATITESEKPYIHLDFSYVRNATTFRKLAAPYLITSTFAFRADSDVTVDAGVEFNVDVDVDIYLSYFNDKSTFKLKGTETEPIVFQGLTKEAGFWAGLIVDSGASTASTMEHVTIRHAGGQDAYALDVRQNILWKNVTLEDNKKGAKIKDDGFNEDSTSLVITGTKGVPLVIESESILSIPPNSKFTGNDIDEVHIELSPVSGTGTIAKLDVPYIVLDDLSLRKEADVTFEAGVTIKFSTDTTLHLSYFGDSPKFTVAGTDSEPVTFTGRDATSGSWLGAKVGSKVKSDSSITHAIFEHGGKTDEANLFLDAPVAISNSTFKDSSGYGLIVSYRDGTEDYTTGNTYSGNTQGDILDERK